MKKNIFKLVVDHSFLYSALSLFFSVVFIHLIYIVLITPLADEQISISIATQSGLERTFPVILKDPEQEICLILFAWSLFLAFAIYAKNTISLEILDEGNIRDSPTHFLIKVFLSKILHWSRVYPATLR